MPSQHDYDFSKPWFFPQNPIGSGGRGGPKRLFGIDPADRFKGMKFFCGTHPICTLDKIGRKCFWHEVKAPEKDGKTHPLFDYQADIFNRLEGTDVNAPQKYIWLKKSRGIGITEFFIRYLCWLGLAKNDLYKGCQFFVVCGPRQQVAIKLIKRIKSVLRPLKVLEETERTIARFLNVQIEAFPSHHLDTMRGDVDVKFIYIDEADFFPISQQNEVRRMAEGYLGKTDPYIVFVSTPNNPGGLYEKMEFDQSRDFFYKRIFLPYTKGLGKIYSEKEIKMAMLSPSFEREYNLAYGYGTGNLCLPEQLEDILDYHYNTIDTFILNQAVCHMGVDPGHAFSKFAYVITSLIDGKIHVVASQEFEKAGISDMVEEVAGAMDKYSITNTSVDKVFVDGSQNAFIRDLKYVVGEPTDYERVIKDGIHNKIADIGALMKVVPVSFAKDGHKILDHLQALIAKNALVIPTEHEKLVQQLRVAKEKNGRLDKELGGETFDSLDALMLACSGYQY